MENVVISACTSTTEVAPEILEAAPEIELSVLLPPSPHESDQSELSDELGDSGVIKKKKLARKSLLMIVSTLLMAMVYQMGVSPPGSRLATQSPKDYDRYFAVNLVSFTCPILIIALLLSGLNFSTRYVLPVLLMLAYTALGAIAWTHTEATRLATPTNTTSSISAMIRIDLVLVFGLLGIISLGHLVHAVRISMTRWRRGAKKAFSAARERCNRLC
ncbi:hypothetical protein CASFOL_004107 [Castilleja foliolosa]|uniref:PGG domain-containing protein n=1 Tax=Castilleja foliolosa TaxID=1961234 RepID=A0ABD3EJI5_9LAMI